MAGRQEPSRELLGRIVRQDSATIHETKAMLRNCNLTHQQRKRILMALENSSGAGCFVGVKTRCISAVSTDASRGLLCGSVVNSVCFLDTGLA